MTCYAVASSQLGAGSLQAVGREKSPFVKGLLDQPLDDSLAADSVGSSNKGNTAGGRAEVKDGIHDKRIRATDER